MKNRQDQRNNNIIRFFISASQVSPRNAMKSSEKTLCFKFKRTKSVINLQAFTKTEKKEQKKFASVISATKK